jgi:hypothetical protein
MAFGAADGKVIIDTQLNNNGFVKGVKGLKGELGGLKTVLRQIGTVVASAFAVRTLVNFGKECVELGSNVAEVQNVVDTAFGDMTYKVETFANRAIQDFGMSRLAAKKTASTYMAMAKGMGIADEAASDMSITLAGLTGDVASFYNISQELADTKLKSVFTGETETLKDLGVVMTQDNLKAYALSQGITKSYDAMTQAEKVALRYNYVLDSLALAQGDFAKTSNGWANQTRILSMQWQEFMSIIGQALITVLTPCVRVLNQIVSSLISVANTVNTVVASLFGGQNTQIENATAVGDAISGAVDNQNALTEATKETAKAQKSTLAGFDEINKLGGEGSAGTDSSAGGALAVAGTATYEVDVEMAPASEKVLTFFESLRVAVQPVETAMAKLWDQLKHVGAFTGDALKGFYTDFLKPVGEWIMGEGLPKLVDTLANGMAKTDWSRISRALDTLWVSLAPFAEKVGEGLLWLWESVFVPFGTWVNNEVIPRFLDVLAASVDLVNEAVTAAQPALQWLWDVFLKPLSEYTGGVILSILEALHGWIVLLTGLLSGDFEQAATGANEIVEAFGKQFEFVKQVAGLAWTTIKTVFSEVAGWFSEHVLDPVSQTFKKFINGLIGFVEGLINFFVRGINKIIDAANSLSFDIPEILGGGTIGFDLARISEVKLPRLATGAVIPPNREFLAVLGDQKSGTNIEAPLSTIEQAVENVLNRRGTGGSMTLTVKPAPGLTRYLKYELDAETTRRGGKLTQGGTA